MHRIILESYLHSDNCFVTLTYRTENLRNSAGQLVSNSPMISNSKENDLFLPSLQPTELRNFLKRLRKRIEPHRIRFYGVGEYGDENERPHYHLALFNFPTCLRGRTLKDNKNRPLWSKCCDQCRLIGETWALGDIDLGMVEEESAQYLSGYVVKKLDDTHIDLRGRYKEFSRKSNRPGIGHDFMFEVASQLLNFDLENTQADVPSALRHGSRLLPLGRYLRMKLRKMVGRDEKTPQAIIDEMAKDLLELRIDARNSSENPSVKARIIERDKGKVASLKAKEKLFRQRKSL